MSTTKTLFKIVVYLFAGIALTVVLPFAVWAIMNDSDLSDTLDANWGIVLSDEAGWEERYHADSSASFHGDGCVYWYQSDTDGSEMIMCWNKAEEKIYIAESFQ